MLLSDMSVYGLAVEVGDEIWEIVKNWDSFEKYSVGNQMTRGADSIGANIAEGFGRFHIGEKIKFYYYSRGSVYETQHWIRRSCERELVINQKSVELLEKLDKINKELNKIIKTQKNKRS